MPGTEVEARPDRAPVRVPGMPGPRRPEGAVPAAFRAARRNRHVSVPLAVPPALWTGALVLHAVHAAGPVDASAVIASAATWYFAPHKWDRPAEVAYARASALAGSGWLALAATLGPLDGAGLPLAALLAAGASAWGLAWWRHYRPRGRRRRRREARELERWQSWWEYHCAHWGVAGSRVTGADDDGVTVRLRVQLLSGRQSVQHVKGAVHLIESALEGLADTGMVRVQVVKGNPSQVDVFLKRENPLAGTVEWSAEFAPASVHDEAAVGLSETGTLVRAPLRVNAFINGRTRSGKTNFAMLRIAQLSGCPDARTVVIDLKQRNARDLIRSRAVEYVITGQDEARAWLALASAEVAARARNWDTGEEQALATADTPALFTFLDEANMLTGAAANDLESTRLLGAGASRGSGLEVYFLVSTQYGSLEESVQTEQTRMNLRLRVCFAVETAEHGQFALGDGWRFDASKLEGQGEFLMKMGPRAREERLRAPHVPFSRFREVAGANAARLSRRPLKLWCGNEPSVVAGLTWQEWWDRRWLRIDPAFRKDSPQYAAAVEQYGEPEETSVPVAADTTRHLPDGEEPGAAVAAAIAAETAGDDLAPSPGAAARAADLQAANRRRFADVLAGSPGGITAADLERLSGMSGSWVYDKLRRLRDRSAVTQVRRGVYAPSQGRDLHAELAALDAGDAALRSDAERRLALVR